MNNILTRTNTLTQLIPLTMGGFSIGMTEFLMMGILPDIAKALSITIPTAGYFIAIYAFGVVIGAPLLIALINKYPPKKLLTYLMWLFVLCNLLFAVAPKYHLLLLARFMSGLPHGAFFGIGAVVATKLVSKGNEARAVAMMFAGLTLANIIGVPIGTYIGHYYSWRVAYFLVSIFGILTLYSIIKWLPDVALEQSKSYIKSLAIFKNIRIWLIIGISAIGTGGLFAWISYIAPLMTEVTLFPSYMVTLIMMIAGLGMAVGNIIGGHLVDRFSPLLVTTSVLIAMIVCLCTVVIVSHHQIPALIMTFITGAVAFAVVPAMQMLMIETAKGAEMLASSTLQASSNMGNTLGAYLGGLPIAAGFGYTSPEYVGIILVSIGLTLSFFIREQRLTVQNFSK